MPVASARLTAVLFYAGTTFCLPLALLVNFLLFLYLFATFYTRRHETRIAVLLGCAIAGFAVLVPFAHPDARVFEHLNRVSESCSALTFLIQITILGRDINTKMRIKSLKLQTLLGELLTVLLLTVAIVECVAAVVPDISAWAVLETIGHVVLNVSLAFIFFFRFNLIIMSKGLLPVLRFGKTEIALYLLYVTSQYPFLLLSWRTGTSWDSIEALWYRLTMLFCLLHTVLEKWRSRARNAAVNTKHHSRKQRTSRAIVTALSRGPKEVSKEVTKEAIKEAAEEATPDGPGSEEVRPVGMIAGPSALVISASHRRMSRQRSSVKPSLT